MCEKECSMHRETNRVKTYSDWPYDHDECLCTSTAMAQAGFFKLESENEPDLVKCFVCLKELDGWEPEDDPWKEHKRHSPKCAFIKLNKIEEDMTVDDVLKLELERQKMRVQAHFQLQIYNFRRAAAELREHLE